jgi:LacI family transcriptional regulator
LQKINFPVVLIDRYFPSINIDSVHINNFQAAFSAVEHLIKVGRRKIGIVTYDTTLPHIQERMEGYVKALEAGGISLKEKWIVKAAYQNIHNDVAAGINNLLSPKLQVDALFFATNSLAVEGLKKINEIGIKVPDKLALISFDQTDAFDFFYSPVTYVSQSLSDLAKEAVELVINRISNNRRKPINIIIDTKLVLRESCGRHLKNVKRKKVM